MRPSPYEWHAWHTIQAWKATRGGPPASRAGGLSQGGLSQGGLSQGGLSQGGLSQGGLSQAARALTGARARLAGRVVEAVLPPLTTAMSDVAQWHVEWRALEHVRRVGARIDHLGQVRSLDLSVLDRAARPIRTRYVPALTAQGAAAGTFGLAGMAVDLPLLVLGNLRAIGEHGVHYGFDLTATGERLWAAQLLVLAAGASQAVRTGAMLNLHQIAQSIARGAGWTDLEQYVVVGVIRQLARTLGVELTRRRLARILPVIGAGVTAVANAKLANDVCEAAFHLYRERFLVAKYGSATLGLPSVQPLPAARLARELTSGHDGVT